MPILPLTMSIAFAMWLRVADISRNIMKRAAEVYPTAVSFDAGVRGVDAVALESHLCDHGCSMLEYRHQQSPNFINWARAARLYWSEPGCRQARCLLSLARYQTSSRLPSDCLCFRLRRSRSHMLSKSNAQLGRADTTRARISFSIRRSLPFESAARNGLCRCHQQYNKQMFMYWEETTRYFPVPSLGESR